MTSISGIQILTKEQHNQLRVLRVKIPHSTRYRHGNLISVTSVRRISLNPACLPVAALLKAASWTEPTSNSRYSTWPCRFKEEVLFTWEALQHHGYGLCMGASERRTAKQLLLKTEKHCHSEIITSLPTSSFALLLSWFPEHSWCLYHLGYKSIQKIKARDMHCWLLVGTAAGWSALLCQDPDDYYLCLHV